MTLIGYLISSGRLALLAIILALTTLLAPNATMAQPSLSSEISPRAGHTDDLFLFTVTLAGVRNGPPPRLSHTDDFEVTLLGPQTSISIVNGVVNSRISYVYHLTPKREGTLRTPEATVSVAGDTLRAAPLEVPIGAGQGGSPTQHKDPGDQLFLRQTLSPTTAYEGQQVVHTLGVYTMVDLNELAVEEPTNDGVWQETIADNQRSMRHINNLEYTTVESLKALFPLRSGTIQIPARKLRAKIPDERARSHPFSLDPFSDDFFQQFFDKVELKPVTITSNELSLEIKPLPQMSAEQRKAAPPIAIVGPTSIRLDYPLETIKTGETKTITIEVTSEGNLNTLKTIPLEVPARFKLYEERPEVKTDRRSGKIVTHKTFKYSVISLSPGLARIPGPKLTYFNPQLGTYEILKTSDVAFPVNGQDLTVGSSQPVQSSLQKADSNTVTSTLATMPPLPIGPPLEYEEPGFMEQLSSYISVQLALLILAGICGLGCIGLVTFQRKAIPEVKEISTSALKDVGTMKDLEAFVKQVISSKLSRVSENSTMDELRSRVTTTLPDKNLALSVSSLLDDIEVYSYGGAAADRDREVHTLKERLAMILMQWQR